MQAIELVAQLKHDKNVPVPRAVVSCPLLRTFQTAVVIAKEAGTSIYADYSLCDAATKKFYGKWVNDPDKIFFSLEELQELMGSKYVQMLDSLYGPIDGRRTMMSVCSKWRNSSLFILLRLLMN